LSIFNRYQVDLGGEQILGLLKNQATLIFYSNSKIGLARL